MFFGRYFERTFFSDNHTTGLLGLQLQDFMDYRDTGFSDAILKRIGISYDGNVNFGKHPLVPYDYDERKGL